MQSDYWFLKTRLNLGVIVEQLICSELRLSQAASDSAATQNFGS